MKISPKIVAPFALAIYRFWMSTIRVTQSGREKVKELEASGNIILFPLWHDDLFPLTAVREDMRILSIISQSNDGDYLAKLQEPMGFKTVRGSSSRGGLKVLLEAAKLMRTERYHCSTAVDGPRGPRHIAKQGLVILAFRANAYVMPVRVFMNRARCLQSWDRFKLPWLFSKVHIVWSEPYKLEITDLSEASLEKERCKMQERLEAIQPPEGFF